MLWSDPYIFIALVTLGIGFVVVSLLISENNKSVSYILLYILQIVANLATLFVFLLRYIDFVVDYFPRDKTLLLLTKLFPSHSSLSLILITIAIVVTFFIGIVYFRTRSMNKRTIGSLFYFNTTPIAILNAYDLFDSNQAFRDILNHVPIDELHAKNKIDVEGKTYLIKKYTYRNFFAKPRDMTMVLLDISEQELTLHRLNSLNRRLSMISQLLKNKLQLVERLVELKSRNVIAIQLHDEIGHNLTLAVSVLDRMMDENLRARIPANSIEQLLQEGKHIAISLSDDRKNAVSGKYLKEMLESYILYLKWVGIHVELDIDTKRIELNQQSILILYAICKEAFSNTIKYANASEVRVEIKIMEVQDEEMLILLIHDNGSGCVKVKESNGIKVIRSRVERNQGVFEYDGSEGFKIICRLPLQRMTEVG